MRHTHAGYGVCSLSGYSLRHCYTALAAMVAGAPWLDTRPIRDVGVLIAAPMVAVGQAPDPAPWHGFSHASVEAVFRHYAAAGAHVGNLALARELERRRRP